MSVSVCLSACLYVCLPAGISQRPRVHTLLNVCTCYLWPWLDSVTIVPPFPQIDINGAMVIVWRARGKIIRSVLCSIVHNNCTQ